MKKKNKIRIFLLVTMGLALIISNSCKKDKKDEPKQTTNTLIDIDGNVYHTVIIGSQEWMVENLKTTKYRDGTPITFVNDSTTWSMLTTEAYCNYNNDTNNAITYGRLYNWYAVNDSRNIAPIGWHVASNAEWLTLINYLGGESVAGGKLKETGIIHWINPNVGATNSVGFKALPGGYCYLGGYENIGYCGYWWSSTEESVRDAYCRILNYSNPNAYSYELSKDLGHSVRCIKD